MGPNCVRYHEHSIKTDLKRESLECPITRRCRCRRNDAIKHVREAAEIALNRMQGDEAKKAIEMTALLSEEMKLLKEM